MTADNHIPLDKRSIPAIPVRDLVRRSDRIGLARLFLHGAAIGVTGYGIALAGDSWLLALLLPLHGALIAFLFCALHELIHRTAMKTRQLNDGIAFLLGAILFLPSNYFRTFHFAHHRHTQNPEMDPELSGPPIDSVRKALVYTSGLSYWRDQISVILRHAGGRISEGFVPEAKRKSLIWEARALLLVYTSILALSIQVGSDAALRFWIAPLLLGMLALRLYLLAEHKLCPFTSDMMRNTRTTRTNALVRLVAWNMPYHTEHHAFPAVPFHKLPELHARLAPHEAEIEDGYLRFLARFMKSLARGKA